MSLLEELASFCVTDFSKDDEDRNRENKTIPMGPWGSGSEDGYEWSFNEDGDAQIKRVVVKSERVIDSLTFDYVLDDEDDYVKFGGDGGSETEMTINYPDEYLTEISGTYSKASGSEQTVISSLKFVTNLKQSAEAGHAEGTHFKLPLEGGKILGFHGRMDAHINAIGVYMKAAKQM